MGVDPRPFTLRQLLWMAEGQGREHWAHTSMLCTLIANIHRDPKKTRPFKPKDFDPYARLDRHRQPVADKQSLSILKEALVARKPQKGQ